MLCGLLSADQALLEDQTYLMARKVAIDGMPAKKTKLARRLIDVVDCEDGRSVTSRVLGPPSELLIKRMRQQERDVPRSKKYLPSRRMLCCKSEYLAVLATMQLRTAQGRKTPRPLRTACMLSLSAEECPVRIF